VALCVLLFSICSSLLEKVELHVQMDSSGHAEEITFIMIAYICACRM
jgi:hypothetical protein